jgi:hypothetical protein
VRNLRTEIEGRSHLGHDFSYDKGEIQSLYHGAVEPANLDQIDGEASINEGIFNFLKHLDSKPILQDYLRVLQKNPEEITIHFDVERNVYVAVFRNKLLVVDLKKMTVEGGPHHASDLSQISFFQRSKLSIQYLLASSIDFDSYSYVLLVTKKMIYFYQMHSGQPRMPLMKTILATEGDFIGCFHDSVQEV